MGNRIAENSSGNCSLATGTLIRAGTFIRVRRVFAFIYAQDGHCEAVLGRCRRPTRNFADVTPRVSHSLSLL